MQDAMIIQSFERMYFQIKTKHSTAHTLRTYEHAWWPSAATPNAKFENSHTPARHSAIDRNRNIPIGMRPNKMANDLSKIIRCFTLFCCRSPVGLPLVCSLNNVILNAFHFSSFRFGFLFFFPLFFHYYFQIFFFRWDLTVLVTSVLLHCCVVLHAEADGDSAACVRCHTHTYCRRDAWFMRIIVRIGIISKALRHLTVRTNRKKHRRYSELNMDYSKRREKNVELKHTQKKKTFIQSGDEWM